MKSAYRHKYKIEFDKISWENIGEAVRQKVIVRKDDQLRMLEFNDKFEEINWCTAAHKGFVIEGEMKIDFSGNIIAFKKGDGIYIEQGEEHKHKALIDKGKKRYCYCLSLKVNNLEFDRLVLLLIKKALYPEKIKGS